MAALAKVHGSAAVSAGSYNAKDGKEVPNAMKESAVKVISAAEFIREVMGRVEDHHSGIKNTEKDTALGLQAERLLSGDLVLEAGTDPEDLTGVFNAAIGILNIHRRFDVYKGKTAAVLKVQSDSNG